MRQSAQSTHFETQTGILRNALLRSYLHSLTLSTQMNLDLVDFLAVAVIRSCLSSTSVIHYIIIICGSYLHIIIKEMGRQKGSRLSLHRGHCPRY